MTVIGYYTKFRGFLDLDVIISFVVYELDISIVHLNCLFLFFWLVEYNIPNIMVFNSEQSEESFLFDLVSVYTTCQNNASI